MVGHRSIILNTPALQYHCLKEDTYMPWTVFKILCLFPRQGFFDDFIFFSICAIRSEINCSQDNSINNYTSTQMIAKPLYYPLLWNVILRLPKNKLNRSYRLTTLKSILSSIFCRFIWSRNLSLARVTSSSSFRGTPRCCQASWET